MRKWTFILGICLSAIIVSIVIIACVYTTKVYTFDLSVYEEIIIQFPSDKVLGQVTSAKDAKEKAEDVWVELFGEDVKEEKPYSVSYDENSGVWMVHGYLPWYMVGGVAHILIRESDGAVLAVWHEK